MPWSLAGSGVWPTSADRRDLYSKKTLGWWRIVAYVKGGGKTYHWAVAGLNLYLMLRRFLRR